MALVCGVGMGRIINDIVDGRNPRFEDAPVDVLLKTIRDYKDFLVRRSANWEQRPVKVITYVEDFAPMQTDARSDMASEEAISFMVEYLAKKSLTHSIHQVLCHPDNLIEIFMHKCNDHTTNLTVEVIESILALKPTPLTMVT